MTGNTSATGGYLTPTSGPIEDDDLVDLIQEAVVGITGLDGTLVFPRWQTEPPNLPDVGTNWAAVGISDRDQDTFAVEQFNPAANNETLIRHEELNVLVSFYGPGCDGYATLLRDGFGLAQNREALAANGLAFIASRKPQRAPDLIKSQWVTRMDLPFTLRREVDRTYAVLKLTSASIAVETQTNSATLTETLDVT